LMYKDFLKFHSLYSTVSSRAGEKSGAASVTDARVTVRLVDDDQ
jgi:hypothetical protein